MPADPEDKKEKNIILRAKKGDLRAFEEILLLYEKRIYIYVYGFVQQKHDAEDLTQETFVKLYKNLKNIDPDKSFKSWLYKIATNTVYDWLRRKKNTPPVLILGEDSDKIEELETIDNGNPYDTSGDKAELEKALGKLKPIYKTALDFFYRHDLGYKEISQIMNVPINTLKTYIYRAKAELRKMLNKNERSKF